MSSRPEKPQLTLGYMPLTDCLPLIAARELGLFEQEGLQVQLRQESSWASLRDRLLVGELDAAQMLSPMVLATTLGLGGWQRPLLSALVLNLNGNAITLSNELYQALCEEADGPVYGLSAARALARLLAMRNRHTPPPVLASVFPFSNHHYQLRYWLAAGGVNPDRDLRLVVLPPAQMAERLSAGEIDGYCVGEPWNSAAVQAGVGQIVVTGHDIAHNLPEKVLAVCSDWAKANPATHAALIRALHQAGAWLDRERHSALELLADGLHVPAPLEALRPALTGRLPLPEGTTTEQTDFLVFHRYCASFPWLSHGRWLLSQMRRWGQLSPNLDLASIASACFRPDLLRDAVPGPWPLTDHKREGSHPHAWLSPSNDGPIWLGSDRMIDAAMELE